MRAAVVVAMLLAAAAAQPTTPGHEYIGEGLCDDADEEGNWAYYQNIAKDFKSECDSGDVDCLRAICTAACTAAEFTIASCRPGATDCTPGAVVSCLGTTVEPIASFRCRLHVPAQAASIEPVTIDGADWDSAFSHADPAGRGRTVGAIAGVYANPGHSDYECWKNTGGGGGGEAGPTAIATADDVCSGKLQLDYLDATGAVTKSVPIWFGTDGDAEIEVKQGTLTLTVLYMSCDGEVLFKGESEPIAYLDTSTSLGVDIVALSTQTYEDADFSRDAPPIIVQTVISPSSSVEIDETVTMRFVALDPVGKGDFAKDYTLIMDPANADIVGEDACTDMADPDGDGRTVCEIAYTPRRGHSGGRVPYSMSVADLAGQASDSKRGEVGVDTRTGLTTSIRHNSPPRLSSPVSAEHTARFGESLTIELSATDVDLGVSGTDEDLKLEVLSFTQKHTLVARASGDLKAVPCDMAQVSVSASPAVGQDQGFRVDWAPWADVKLVGSAAEYGETWCELEFRATDKQGQESQRVIYTVAAIGTAASAGFNQVPLFEQKYAPKKAKQGEQIQLYLEYSDPDSPATLRIDTGGLGLSTIDPASIAGQTCPPPVNCEARIPVQVDGVVGTTYTVKVTLEDDLDSTKNHIVEFPITVEAPRGRARRAEPSSGLLSTQFTIGNGKLTAKAGTPTPLGSQGAAVATRVSTTAAPTAAPRPRHHGAEFGHASNHPGEDDDSGSTPAHATALVAVGCAMVVCAMIAGVAVFVVKRRGAASGAGSSNLVAVSSNHGASSCETGTGTEPGRVFENFSSV